MTDESGVGSESMLLNLITHNCYYEFKEMLLKALPVSAVMNLGQCCKALRWETTRPKVFLMLLHRDFPSKKFIKLKQLQTIQHFRDVYMEDTRILKHRNTYGYFTMSPIHGGPHKEVILDHNHRVMLGRNELTGITDTSVDEEHMMLRANCLRKRIRLKQLGANPCLVGCLTSSCILNKGLETILDESDIHVNTCISLLNGRYMYKLTFTTKGSAIL